LPDLVLVDGGAGQVASARAALDAAGLPDVPLAGLAKRFEEIHRPGGGAPLHLPRDSRALQVLQHLRDEAHRFALTYHRLLRARRIQESRLDEVSGVGPALKRRLLERFGSVQRLARASDEDLAAVPGIGDRLVAAIRQGLAEGNDRPGKTTA
jgi:excinuclease ABC subunit C